MWPPVPCLWPGETAFVVGGGPSVLTQNLELLRGRNVIAINSSWTRVPWATVLFFGDDRWWREYGRDVIASFVGVVTTTRPMRNNPRVVQLINSRPQRPGTMTLSSDPSRVPMRRTSFAPAINIACHMVGRGGRVVLLGADGKLGGEGLRNHYADAYPRYFNAKMNPWDEHYKDLSEMSPSIAAAGVEVVNASPGTAWGNLWPVVDLREVL